MSPSTAVERIGHRGAPREALENTLPSFRRALELGADAIELDAHVTVDGVVVVHHDDAVLGKAIAATRWADLEHLELRDGGRLPRLEEVFELTGDRVSLYIELKGRGVTESAIALVRKFGRGHAVHSFDHAAVELASRIAPDIPRGVLLDEGTGAPAEAMRSAVTRTRARDVWPHWSLVNADFMTAAKALGVRVIVWTVNARNRAARLTDLGVAGICTDDLSLFRES